MSRRGAHDPGPWRLERARLRAGVTLIYADRRLVALVIGLANARLVARAPELLAAATRAAAWWEAARPLPEAEAERALRALRDAVAALQRTRGL